jgi:hypothetical protein
MMKGHPMNLALWVVQAILSIKLITAAFSHGFPQSKPEMQQAIEKIGTGARFWHVLVATLCVLTAAGLILPGLLGFWPQITAWAAGVVALMMLGSIYFHVRFRDKPMIFVSVILFIFAVFIAYGRLVLYPF